MKPRSRSTRSCSPCCAARTGTGPALCNSAACPYPAARAPTASSQRSRCHWPTAGTPTLRCWSSSDSGYRSRAGGSSTAGRNFSRRTTKPSCAARGLRPRRRPGGVAGMPCRLRNGRDGTGNAKRVRAHESVTMHRWTSRHSAASRCGVTVRRHIAASHCGVTDLRTYGRTYEELGFP